VRDEIWISKRLAEAQEAQPSVPDTVASYLALLLRGELIERQLSSKELASLADKLLEQMAEGSSVRRDGTLSED
jgi:hypothetical protein